MKHKYKYKMYSYASLVITCSKIVAGLYPRGLKGFVQAPCFDSRILFSLQNLTIAKYEVNHL